MFGMKKVSSSAYSPSTQGSIERYNKFMHASLRKLLNTKKNWNDYLAPIQFTYNSTISKGHDFSPSFLYFCHEPSSMFDLNLDIKLDQVNFNSRYNLQEFINQALYARQIAKDNIIENQATMKQYFDKKTKNIKYKINDIVLLHNTRNTYDLPRKLSQNFLGPFYIHEVLPNNAYRLRHFATGKQVKFPVNSRRLKLAHLPSESRIRSLIPNRIDEQVAQAIRENQLDNQPYIPPGNEILEEEVVNDQPEINVDNGNQDENEAIITNTPSQSQGNTPLIDVSVTKVIRLVLNKHGRWYHCLFSDDKQGFLHYNERDRIPKDMRDEIHSKFTWKMKRKIKNKSHK